MIDGAGGRECIVENCYSANCETSPFQMDAASYEFAAEASDAAGNRLPIVFADPNTSGWSNSRDFIIRDCRVVGAKYAAVHLHNTNNQNVLIQGCTFESCFTGVYSDEECTQVNVNIDNCFFINNVVDVQGLSDHYGMTIKGCLFYGTAYVTDHYYGIRIPTLNQVTNQRVGVQVIGNRFVGKPRPVIIEDMNNVYINDNIFDRCGIEFAASENEVVSSNPAALVRIAGCNQAYIQSNAFTDCQIATIISSDPTVLIEMPSWIIISDNVSRRSSACMISTRSTNKMIVKGNINGNGPQPDFINYFFGDSRSGTIEGCRVNTSSGHGIRLNGGIFNIVKHNYFESPVDTNYAIQIIGSEGCITDHNVVQSGFISDRNMMATGSSFVECDEPFITLMYESPAIVRYIDHTFVEL